ncbi:MAG: Gfo/Idh/MocA family oxidoreductase [Betaproteobacteria bacterium]
MPAESGPVAAPAGTAPLRIAIAGAGAISQYHLAGWNEAAGVELVAICDPIEDKAQRRAREFGIPATYTDFAAMLEAEQPDAVDIITPVGTHAPLTRLAADAGVHVCCQKPLCATVAEARALIDCVGERVRFMVHENYRYRPHYALMRQWVEQGRIGEVRHARMTVRSASCFTGDGTEPFLLKRQPYLRTFPRLLLFEVLIHQLDAMRVILGPLEVTAARISQVNPELAGEDVAVVTLAGARGMTAVLDGNISAPGYPPLPVDRFELMGSRNTMIYDRDRLYLEGSSELPVLFDLAKNYQVCFSAAVRDFVHGLATGAPFGTDRLDNLRTLELMEACYVAAGVAIPAWTPGPAEAVT